MKAAVLKGPRDLVVEEVPVPEPGTDQVLVRIRCCGICGSDLHIYTDPRIPPGSIMGHEFAATVIAMGPGANMHSVGDRVWPGTGVIPGYVWKPEYAWDFEALLRDDYVRQMGGYGEYAVFHQASLAPIPEEVGDIEACVADPVATALGGIRSVRLQLGESLLILGAGPIGLASLHCAQLAGARAICVAEPRQGRAIHAQAMGADLVVDPTQLGVQKQVVQFFDGVGADVVLECSGAPSALLSAVELVRPGGRIAAVGIRHTPVSINTLLLSLKDATIHSVGPRPIDRARAMDLIRRRRVDCRELVSETISLDQLPGAFERLLQPADEEKIVVIHRTDG